MKYCKAKLKECEDWIQEHGLYPQLLGASVKEYCDAMGIDWKTHKFWEQKSDYSDAITRANEIFRQRMVNDAKQGLKESVKGRVVQDEKLEEYGAPKEGGGFVTKKVKRTTFKRYVPADSKLVVFALTNLDPEHWKDKQTNEVDANVNVEKPQIVFTDTDEEAD